MKKLVSILLSLLMVFSIMSTTAFAADNSVENASDVKTIEVSLADVITAAANPTSSKDLAKDFATSTGQTGTIYSIGQYVDFSSAIPAGSTIVSVTMYCPTSVRVTQSKYTAINNFIISSGSNRGTIPFVRTDTPTAACKSTLLAGAPANVKWLVQIEGKILMQDTGMDGFTVFGGAKMIIEYK